MILLKSSGERAFVQEPPLMSWFLLMTSKQESVLQVCWSHQHPKMPKFVPTEQEAAGEG